MAPFENFPPRRLLFIPSPPPLNKPSLDAASIGVNAPQHALLNEFIVASAWSSLDGYARQARQGLCSVSLMGGPEKTVYKKSGTHPSASRFVVFLVKSAVTGD
ncbi:hypothetical protein [Desulfosarcina ovata]|uniref:hypothetical protein n=1 Tax=Desulfosarcina ovata TaxID=83564 RepID=UPI0012D30F4D|nr:hypothetical protein [Desulfosarcina ovata]